MKLTSYGAAEEVTGSKHLVEINGRRILLDCGMFQGRREESDRKNRSFGFDPRSLDAVVLSHAHIDHTGLLPMLAKQGYANKVFCTPATRDLCALMLMDTAQIQKRDAEYLSKKNRSSTPPLYAPIDAEEIMRHFITIPYETPYELFPGIRVTWHDAGHVLGSAMVEILSEEEGRERCFIFSGDIGRKNMSILNDPWEPQRADIVVMESTYGDRDHAPIQEVETKLGQIVNEAVETKGIIMVPTFALERAQEVIYSLKKLEMRNAIPNLPVYIDSPLTVNITDIFRQHIEAFDPDFAAIVREAGDPFRLRSIHYIRDVDESKALARLQGPAIIIAAAGMCEHGRILHHIKNHCENPNNTILIVGFQAKNTLGRRIVERQRTIRVLGQERELNARVRVMNEYSAHAGRTELIEFALRLREASAIRLVHGELEAMNALGAALNREGLMQVANQRYGETTEV